MSDQVIYNAEHDTFMVKTKKTAAIITSGAKKGDEKPTPLVKNETLKRAEVAPWGKDNLFPQNVYKEIKDSTVVGPALNKQAKFLYAGGIVWGNVEGFDNQGNEIFVPSKGEDYRNVRNYLRKIKHLNYILTAAKDLYWYYNVYPTFNLSQDRKMVANLGIYRAMDCRWGWQNEKSGMLDTVYISKKWNEIGTSSIKDRTDVLTLPAIDPLFDPVGQVRTGAKTINQYIYPISYPSQNCNFYQLADWDGLRTGKWLKFSLQIPAFKEALMENQMTMKYHIEISEDYWPTKITNWDNLDNKQRRTEKEKIVKGFLDIMKGAENTGNTLTTGFLRDKHTGKETGDWKVNVLDDKLKDGAYVEDSQEASSHLLGALGLNQNLFGINPGKGIAPGSGSDIRESFNLYISSIKAEQDLLLQPLEFIRDYHVANGIKGWNTDMEFRFKNSISITLDKGAEMQEK